MSNNAPIGIFDSGIGGLTVFAAIRRRLPHESLVYLGDTARVPYGTKSDETVVRYSLENADFLEGHGVKAIVVACNTASAVAIPALRERSNLPVVGVVEPGAIEAIRMSRTKRIGVIGTQATITSDAYGKALRGIDAEVSVSAAVCSLFVPLVEEGWLDGGIPEQVARQYLAQLKDHSIDTLILGCTHYPLLRDVIGGVMGPGVVLVDSGEATAQALINLLDGRGLRALEHDADDDRIYVTDVPARFRDVAGRFLGGELPRVIRV